MPTSYLIQLTPRSSTPGLTFGIDSEQSTGCFWLNSRGHIPTESPEALARFLIEATPDTREYYDYDRFLTGRHHLREAIAELREHAPKLASLIKALAHLEANLASAEEMAWLRHCTECKTPFGRTAA